MYDDAFNKGILMNAAFQQIFENKIANTFDCLFFHDIDLVPIGKIYIFFVWLTLSEP